MPFSDEQKVLLAAPLLSTHVKQREQSGRRLSYVEGWHAIAEANRIFGFDRWSRETLELRCVTEGKRTMKSGEGFGVSYIAKVRVVVDGITREGFGAGHGIDRDCGLAHESAAKEAETDAMKRALMTFGNPFGLALYDKEQASVAEPPAYQFSDNPPPGVNADLWQTAFARADGGMSALASWWKDEATKAEQHALARWKDDFKAHAAKQKEAA